MTRESRARWLAFITPAVVVLLAALFSVLRNLPMPVPPPAAPAAPAPAQAEPPAAQPQTARESPPTPEPSPTPEAPTRSANGRSPTGARTAGPAAAADPERISTGERAYARLGCATCHSIAGRGRPSSPLDGVGSRLDRRALLEFTTGTGAALDALGAGLARRKARAVDDPDLDALIDYLAQLK